ncbi:MAG TPA: GspE/PulE family protein [bacterium]|nr:GspE/PulE family protein [bacterium]HOL47368.1 GspE/PulE family protein [bacterium]HPQ18899.1 GspE/PulE family protein [bacterium]
MNINLLKEIIIENNILSSEEIQNIINRSDSIEEIIEYLNEQKIISEDKLYLLYSEKLENPFINLSYNLIDNKLLKMFDITTIKENLIIPLFKICDRVLLVAMADPLNIYIIEEIKKKTNFDVLPLLASKSKIIEIINSIYQLTDSINSIIEQIYKEEDYLTEEEKLTKKIDLSVETSSIVKLVDMIIRQAIIERASDIHIEPEENELKIRFRIDGILYKKISLPINIQNNLISRIKVISGMDISEKRLPQDGRIKLVIDNKEVDIRVSTSPTIKGEKIVLRLLEKRNLIKDIERLGIDDVNLKLLKEILEKKSGIIIVCGPTGCGKTTSLYTILQNLDSQSYNIITIEDPVEYILENINQIEVNLKIGLTFANGLRSILRQDPDIILVGEIRDTETAKIGIQSALTGHLVLTTLHTNTSISSISRLIDMGIEPYLISSSINGVIAQRLVRKLCNDCKQPIKLNKDILTKYNFNFDNAYLPERIYQKTGCSSCNYTGYKGRTGVFEILKFDKEIKEMVLKKTAASKIKEYAIKNNFKTLKQSALEKVLAGITDFEEINKQILFIEEE